MPDPVIKITGFIGEQPRIIPRLMAETAAQDAVNSRLDDGALTPMRESSLLHVLTDDELISPVSTIYKNGDEWLAWNSIVYAAPGPVATDRLYWMGDGAPKLRVGEETYPLAVPRPLDALAASVTGSGTGDVTTRVYVATYVTAFGEESEPSAVSNEVEWQPGQGVDLTGFASIPEGRAIAKQRIYRSQSGALGTGFYLIAERDAADDDFTDDIPQDAFQEPLPSTDWNAPPESLTGLTEMSNGMMAAFSGKDIYFCEPYRPHAWPEKYVQTVGDEIVAIEAIGTTLIVLTRSFPWILLGSTPASMLMDRIEENFPCINARGVVDMGYAIAYPTHDGLVVVGANGSIALATRSIFNRDDWQALSPSTMRGAQVHGRYVAFYNALGPNAEVMAGMLHINLNELSYLIRSDTIADAAFYGVSERALFYVEAGTKNIRRFDAPYAKRMPQYWRSKEFVLSAPLNFGALRFDSADALSPEEVAKNEEENAAIIQANEAMIVAGPVGGEINGAVLNAYPVNGDALTPLNALAPETAITVYADKRAVATLTRPNVPLRLPAGFKARTWEFAVSGTRIVEQVTIAKTIDALKEVG